MSDKDIVKISGDTEKLFDIYMEFDSKVHSGIKDFEISLVIDRLFNFRSLHDFLDMVKKDIEENSLNVKFLVEDNAGLLN